MSEETLKTMSLQELLEMAVALKYPEDRECRREVLDEIETR